MKRLSLLIALSVSLVSAEPVKWGFQAGVGYNFLSLGSSMTSTTESAFSFGFSGGPVAAIPVNPKVDIALGPSLLWDDYGIKQKGGSSTADFRILWLGLGVAPTLHITEDVSIRIGYEWDIPLTGSLKGETGSGIDLKWAPEKASDVGSNTLPIVSMHNILLGLAYNVTPSTALDLQLKFGMRGIVADYNSSGTYNGAASASSNISATQLRLGFANAF